MKHTRRWLSVMLVLVLVFSLCTSAFAADTEQEPQPQTTDGGKLRASLQEKQIETVQSQPDVQYKAGDQVHAIVLLKGTPTAENKTFQRGLNTDNSLMREHSSVKNKMQKASIDFKVNYEYTALLNGMSVTIDYADVDKLAALENVEQVVICREYRIPDTQPNASNASDMIYAGIMNQLLGADGSGKVIAILDTGISASHEAFQVYDGMLQTPAYDYAGMKRAISLLGYGNYISQKVPFQYDYADGDNDATDDNSGHGSHVAGIAAGYVATPEGEILFHGSAPDAQILAMKIFSSESSTTSSDIYFAALEDAYKLGADVINMSIGAPSGFVEDDESVLNDRIYERLEAAGIVVCCSAGNEQTLGEYSSNFLNQVYGTSYVMGSNADYGMLGTPASYTGNVAVASLENIEYPTYNITVGDQQFPYNDTNGGSFLNAFGGQDLEYVVVPGVGAPEDFEGLDVNGKIALVTRGEITFVEKIANATAAGAKGVVVCNNTTGMINMAVEEDSIPAIFVDYDAGEAMKALETKTFHVDDEMSIQENPDAWFMSSFSSWGPTNDLQIKPTITGVGGNVYSVTHLTENGYEVMSGTSMSSPNVSGGYASLLEAITNDNPEMSKADAAALARNRSLSHAEVMFADVVRDNSGAPVVDDNGDYTYIPYSPRQQGAGLMNVAYAYLSELDITDPLVELGDREDGVFAIEVELENVSGEEKTYAIQADVLTDTPTYANIASEYHFYNALQPMLLEEDVDYTLSGPESVTLADGEKKSVTLTITLTADAMEFLDFFFENGAFIDGYVHFIDVEGGYEEAHASFLGFYGDWEAQPIITSYDWRDDLSEALAENDTIPTEAYLIDKDFNGYLYGGDAPIDYPEDYEFSDARIAVSPNTEATFLNAMIVVPCLERNARHVIMIAHDGDKIFYVDDTPFCYKTFYDANSGQWASFAWFLFDGYDSYNGEEPTVIPDDTVVTLDFYANLPVGEDVLGSMTPEEILASGDQFLQYSMPCTVDGAAPEFDLDAVEFDPETGDLTVTVKDNQFLNAVYVMDLEGNPLCDDAYFADAEPGQSHTVTLNVGDATQFVLGAIDFATNEVDYVITLPHEHEWVAGEVITEATCEEPGEQNFVCALCGEEEVQEIPALGHDWTEWEVVTEATCEADGEQTRVCQRCEKEESEVLPAIGHDWDDGVVTKEPTIAEEGEMTYTCKNDPSHVKTEAIAKLGDCDGGDNCPSKDFTDVDRSPESWSHEPIDWAVLKNITKGTSSTTFSPDKACTRAQAVTFLWRAAGCPAPKATDSPFEDVTLDMWYADAVLWAVEQGITNGTSETTFSPDDTCTRAQIVTFLWRSHEMPEAKADSTFSDVPADAYFAKAVAWAVERGITNGMTETTFEPDTDCTRAHIVTFLYRDWQAEQ